MEIRVVFVLLISLCENTLNHLFLSSLAMSLDNSKFLWAAVNSSLTEKMVPKHCAKLVFFNKNNLGDSSIAVNQTGIVPNSFINITQDFHSFDSSQWKTAEWNLLQAKNKSISENLDPCLVVVSFVINATQYDLTKNDLKQTIRHQMVDLLQHGTPIRQRHLVLIRISDNLNDFRFCTKASKYPIRLVPDWELILFDFFTDARIVQGFFYEGRGETHPYVRISKENGRWKYLCEDIIENLEIEKECNLDEKCLTKNSKYKKWKPGISDVKHCDGEHRPRH